MTSTFPSTESDIAVAATGTHSMEGEASRAPQAKNKALLSESLPMSHPPSENFHSSGSVNVEVLNTSQNENMVAEVIAVFNDDMDSVGQVTVVAQSPNMDGEVATNIADQDISEEEMSMSQGELENQTETSRSTSIPLYKTKYTICYV